jgi:hypothetical protein
MNSAWPYVVYPAIVVFLYRLIREILKHRHDPKATGNPLDRGRRLSARSGSKDPPAMS